MSEPGRPDGWIPVYVIWDGEVALPEEWTHGLEILPVILNVSDPAVRGFSMQGGARVFVAGDVPTSVLYNLLKPFIGWAVAADRVRRMEDSSVIDLCWQ